MDCRTAEGMVSSYIKHDLPLNELEEFLDHVQNLSLIHISDSSHDSACVVGGFDDFTVFDCESIIVSGTV